MTTDDLAQAEGTASAAKAAYAADPSSVNRAAHHEAQTAVREARWRARGGLDNPYGATTYAEFVAAQRAAAREGDQ